MSEIYKFRSDYNEIKHLQDLLKMHNITKTRNETFKKQLKNNLLFCEDYSQILDAYNNNVRLDEGTIRTLASFGFEPLE